mmetsp:Transcript_18989/g.61913  ORF Transcript_18989/g.61913 Transcript_18989/m.61913 type:complete len:275 (+) Transcript_18989:558-1382(+)
MGGDGGFDGCAHDWSCDARDFGLRGQLGWHPLGLRVELHSERLLSHQQLFPRLAFARVGARSLARGPAPVALDRKAEGHVFEHGCVPLPRDRRRRCRQRRRLLLRHRCRGDSGGRGGGAQGVPARAEVPRGSGGGWGGVCAPRGDGTCGGEVRGVGAGVVPRPHAGVAQSDGARERRFGVARFGGGGVGGAALLHLPRALLACSRGTGAGARRRGSHGRRYRRRFCGARGRARGGRARAGVRAGVRAQRRQRLRRVRDERGGGLPPLCARGGRQ